MTVSVLSLRLWAWRTRQFRVFVDRMALEFENLRSLSFSTAFLVIASYANAQNAIQDVQPVPNDPFQDHIINGCEGTQGFGVLTYGTTAETAIRLSDICILEEQGAVVAAESVSDLTLTRQGEAGRSFEDLTTGKPEYQRDTVNLTSVGGCTAERIESIEYVLHDDSVSRFSNEDFAMLQGYTTSHTAPRPAADRAEVLFGLRNITQGELEERSMPLGIHKAQGDTYGEAIFTGDRGTLTIQNGGGHTYGESSGTLEFEFTGDGSFLASGDITVSSNRIAGHAPIEMVNLSGSIPYMRGHVLGSDGKGLAGYGLFVGSYIDASGATHNIRASAYLRACMQE